MNDYKRIKDILAAIEETWIGGTSLCRADYLNNKIKMLPSANVIELNDAYKLIAGHSIYSGDSILSALTCLVEGKNVKPIKPLDVVKRKHGKWIYMDNDGTRYDDYKCSACNKTITVDAERCCDIGFVIEDMCFCPNCGAKMEK